MLASAASADPMTFAAELLHFPDLFPVRHSGERWGAHRLVLDFAGGPYLLDGLSERQERGLRERYRDLCNRDPAAAEAVEIRVFRAPASDFREPAPEPWRDYPLELAAEANAVRIASRRFVGRLDWRPTPAAALWTPIEGPATELVGVFENFLRVLAAYRLVELGGVLLHSAGLVEEGRAFLFVGPSGAGKTTVASLSRAEGKLVLSDDMNVVLPGDRPQAPPRTENLPFAGDLGQISGPVGRYPIAGLFRLEQAASHARRPVDTASAVAALIANAPFLNTDVHRLDRLSENLTRLVERVPLETLAFKRDAGFWSLLSGDAA